MSKGSSQHNRRRIKVKRRDRRQAQAALRDRQQAAGLSASASATISNCKCSFKSEEEERAARLEAVTEQVKVYRASLPLLLKRLSKIPDPRNARKVKHKLTVVMIYGILSFVFQMSSRREANREMTRPVFMENLLQLFPDLEDLPHNDTLGRLLARIDVTQIEVAHLDLMRHWIRAKKFRRYLIAECYPVAIDGTQKFTRAECWAQQCLQRRVKSKEDPEKKRYYVYVLESNLAFANGMVIPLLSEVLEYTKGDAHRKKQDCELKAFGRLAQRLKAAFPRLPILVLLDGLYPNGPIFELCRRNNWDFMIVLQDKVLTTVWEEIDGLKKLQKENQRTQNWGERRQHFQWVNGIEYEYDCPVSGKPKKQTVHAVICEESWEEIAPDSTEVVLKQSRHVWLSAQELRSGNVHERCNLGARHRWGIESGILVEKHQGYQYEHCFSYDWEAMKGYHYLMRLGHALNVMATHCYALAEYVRNLGVRGLIAFVRSTISNPWLDPAHYQQIISAPYQIRLE